MDDRRRFEILARIHRAAHFQWRRTAAALRPDLDPREIVERYWAEVGRDTARYYVKHIDRTRDLAGEVARLIVESSRAMGEDAEVLEPEDGGARVRHVDCPWLHWHRRAELLREDQPGCDRWLAAVVEGINEALGTRLRFETVETLPGGGGSCLRRFWEERGA